MAVNYHNGIGFSDNGTRFLDVEAIANPSDESRPISATVPVISESFTYTIWAPWGAGNNNLLPQTMTNDIETTGILNSIIDSQARFALGKGVVWAWCSRDKTGDLKIEEMVNEPLLDAFMEDNNSYWHDLGWMRDQIGFNNGVGRFMLDKERTSIAAYQRDDVTEMRYQKMNPRTGQIPNIFLSAEWDKVFSNDTPPNDVTAQVRTIPLLDFNFPLRSAQQFAEAGTVEFAMTFRYPSWGKKYYALPLWYAAYAWVKIAQSVPAMKKALFLNSITPKYQVIFYEQFWEKQLVGELKGNKQLSDYTPEELTAKKVAVMEKIDTYLVGTKNAYKSIFTDGYIDRVSGKAYPYMEIKAIEDPASGKSDGYLPTSAVANSEIAFATRFNPSILGNNLPDGPYSQAQGGSNIREAIAAQIITLEPERQALTRIYKFISRFNKWDTTFKPPTKGLIMHPVIPSTILTTLDTGAGTKPVVNGAQPADGNNQKNTPPNGAY